MKKTAAMLMSPFVQSEKKDGVIYVTFEETGLGEVKSEQQKAEISSLVHPNTEGDCNANSLIGSERTKKQTKVKDQTESQISAEDVENQGSENEVDVVFAEEEEYGNDENDFGGGSDDD